ncbi:unnamed protein product [Staurois parvus]|uniref:Uncharacterized protein n=1 Tax=Staurois parvus TaxID=386267 RepID=A0ABN9BJP9_9NEOB|nr:unnamed protein product [Staurois parvus]
MCFPSPESLGVPVGLPLLLSPSPPLGGVPLFQVSYNCWWVSPFFCHRVFLGILAAASTATLWLHTLVLAP